MQSLKIALKIILICGIFICITTYVMADDILPSNDDFDMSEIIPDIHALQSNSNIQQIPTINSRAYVVIDRSSRRILIGKNENQRKKMASTTKIMTCLIIIENCNLSETIEISKKAACTGGSRLGLKYGDKISVYDLLYGLMMRSGNDDAFA